MVNGVKTLPPRLCYAPDNRLYYFAETNDGLKLMIDNRPAWLCSTGWKSRFYFSADGQHVAYFVRSERGRLCAVDGQELSAPGELTGAAFVYSTDGRHHAYVCGQDQRQWVVVDGQAGPAYTQVISQTLLSRDATHFRYLAVQGKTLYEVTVTTATDADQQERRSADG